MFNRNILTVKEEQLRNLVRESENSVSLITATINRLETVNGRISETRKEIESYCTELARLDSSMENQFEHKAKVIDKFKSFLDD